MFIVCFVIFVVHFVLFVFLVVVIVVQFVGRNGSFLRTVFRSVQNQTQINIRGSTDITGPIIYNGNFILESDNVDIKPLYFTEDIELDDRTPH